MKKALASVIAVCLLSVLVGVVNRKRKQQKAGWTDVDTMDDPREYFANQPVWYNR